MPVSTLFCCCHSENEPCCKIKDYFSASWLNLVFLFLGPKNCKLSPSKLTPDQFMSHKVAISMRGNPVKDFERILIT